MAMSYCWATARRANSVKSGAVTISTGVLKACSRYRRKGWYISRMTRALECGATPMRNGGPAGPAGAAHAVTMANIGTITIMKRERRNVRMKNLEKNSQ